MTTWLDFFHALADPHYLKFETYFGLLFVLFYFFYCASKRHFTDFITLSIELCSRSPWLDFMFRFCVTNVPNSPPPLLSAFYDIDASATEHWHLQPQESLLCLRLKCAEGQPQSMHISVDCQVWFTAHNLLWD